MPRQAPARDETDKTSTPARRHADSAASRAGVCATARLLAAPRAVAREPGSQRRADDPRACSPEQKGCSQDGRTALTTPGQETLAHFLFTSSITSRRSVEVTSVEAIRAATRPCESRIQVPGTAWMGRT